MSSGIGQHENDKRWMRAALAEARKAEGRTGTNPPVGCVLISPDNKLIAAGHTMPNGRPHAEAVALAEAGSAGMAHRVVGGTAYVTLEPCQMCAGASYWTQIGKIVYGASELDRGFVNLNTKLHPKTKVVQGILETECSVLIKRFFIEKRNLN